MKPIWGVSHGTGGELVLGGFDPGRYSVLIELADANHKTLAESRVTFDVPRQSAAHNYSKVGTDRPAPKQAPASWSSTRRRQARWRTSSP